MRSLSAIIAIISRRSASGGPPVMTRTFQESSCGTTEMARPVGHSQMSHLPPDRGLKFLARFCRLLQTSITAWGAERDYRLWLSATGAVLKRRAIGPLRKVVSRIMFRPTPLLCRRPQRAVSPFADGGIVQRVVFASGAHVALPSHL